MRLLVGCALVLVACVNLHADDEKIEAKKLVGKWVTENKELGAKMTVQFTKENKLTITMTPKGQKDMVMKGTYKLDGNKLHITIAAGDKEHKETLTVLELDDDELVTKDPKGMKDTFARVEEKDE